MCSKSISDFILNSLRTFFGGLGVELGKVVEIGESCFSVMAAGCVRQHESLLDQVGVRETCLAPVAECSAETLFAIIKVCT